MQVPEQILSEQQKVLRRQRKNYNYSNMKLSLGSHNYEIISLNSREVQMQ